MKDNIWLTSKILEHLSPMVHHHTEHHTRNQIIIENFTCCFSRSNLTFSHICFKFLCLVRCIFFSCQNLLIFSYSFVFTTTKRKKNIRWKFRGFMFKGVLHLRTILWRLYVFSQNIKQIWTKYPRIWLGIFQGPLKSQFYFNRDHCCEVTVNNVWKPIFSMFWSKINNHLSWWNSSAAVRFLRKLPITNISYLPPMSWGAVPPEMIKKVKNSYGTYQFQSNSVY